MTEVCKVIVGIIGDEQDLEVDSGLDRSQWKCCVMCCNGAAEFWTYCSFLKSETLFFWGGGYKQAES